MDSMPQPTPRSAERSPTCGIRSSQPSLPRRHDRRLSDRPHVNAANARSRSSEPPTRATARFGQRRTRPAAGASLTRARISNSLIVVVRDWDTEHQHAWLSCGNPRAEYGGAHVCVQYANGAGIVLAKCWRNDAPRREDFHYPWVIRTSKLGITAGGLRPENMTEERQENVLEADSTEECDAWDVRVKELETVRQLLLNVWKEAEVKTDQAGRSRRVLNDHQSQGGPISLSIPERPMKKQRTVEGKDRGSIAHDPGAGHTAFPNRDPRYGRPVRRPHGSKRAAATSGTSCSKLPGATPFQSLFSSSSVRRKRYPGVPGPLRNDRL